MFCSGLLALGTIALLLAVGLIVLGIGAIVSGVLGRRIGIRA